MTSPLLYSCKYLGVVPFVTRFDHHVSTRAVGEREWQIVTACRLGLQYQPSCC